MGVADTVALADATTRLISALAWPTVVVFALAILRPALHDFLSALGEVRLKGVGFEASARRRLNFDAIGQRLHDFWKPGGKIDRSNAYAISSCMKQLGVAGSVASLIYAGTEQDRARVASRLSL
jgi:hypothetical protein